jgi:hypothetical protein
VPIFDAVLTEMAASDPLTRRVYESFSKFRKSMMAWTDISARPSSRRTLNRSLRWRGRSAAERKDGDDPRYCM